MTGRWALVKHGVLALALVGFAAACGADDDDDDTPIGGTGGTAGGGGTAGTTAGTSGSSAGTGGGGGSAGTSAMVTPAMCAANSKMESTLTAPACIDCVCAKNASVIDKVGLPGWKLIECIGEKCDGVGSDVPCIQAMCMAEAAAMGAVTEATTTSAIFPMCMTECGIGDMGGDDAGI